MIEKSDTRVFTCYLCEVLYFTQTKPVVHFEENKAIDSEDPEVSVCDSCSKLVENYMYKLN